jgi:hypothetical protein
MPINPKVKTIQLVYDASSALLNGNVCNFQIPFQGYYDVVMKSSEVFGGGAGELLLSVSSPQLRISYSCASTDGSNGLPNNTLGLPALTSNYILQHRNGTSTIISPILFPRCLLQNTIQMSITDILTGLPLAVEVVVFTFELHSCDDVIDTKQYLPYV